MAFLIKFQTPGMGNLAMLSPRKAHSQRFRKTSDYPSGALFIGNSRSIPIAIFFRMAKSRCREERGLHAAFMSVFLIVSYSGMQCLSMSVTASGPLFSMCVSASFGAPTFAAPLRVLVRLVIYDKKHLPPESGQGHPRFEVCGRTAADDDDNGIVVINGTERVIVSQLHRSPGVFFRPR